MKKYALGLMSGTSADGLSVALITLKPFRVVHSKTYNYTKARRENILNAHALKADGLTQLSFSLGKFYAKAVKKFCGGFKIKYSDIEVIGSHGQTVVHNPKKGYTLQIGEPSFLAAQTGCYVVSDFRTADMAAGGEGAPLVPFFDAWLFGKNKPVMLLNIGGIANVSVVGKNIKPIGFDTGPGNCLMDLAAKKAVGKAFDKNGVYAAKGKADKQLAHKMFKQTKLFALKPPRSFDRGMFCESFLNKYFKAVNKNNINDICATLNYFTAYTIEQAVRKYILPGFNAKQIIVSGGGAFNKTLMQNLGALLPEVKISNIAQFGVKELDKEAACFAVLAHMALKGKTNSLASVTGAKNNLVLGKIQKVCYEK